MKKITQYSKVRVKHIRKDLHYTICETNACIRDIGTVVDIYHAENYPDGYDIEYTDSEGRTWLAIFHLDEIEFIK